MLPAQLTVVHRHHNFTKHFNQTMQIYYNQIFYSYAKKDKICHLKKCWGPITSLNDTYVEYDLLSPHEALACEAYSNRPS
jgi:hypothetical protein